MGVVVVSNILGCAVSFGVGLYQIPTRRRSTATVHSFLLKTLLELCRHGQNLTNVVVVLAVLNVLVTLAAGPMVYSGKFVEELTNS
jgi:hypothetical protein